MRATLFTRFEIAPDNFSLSKANPDSRLFVQLAANLHPSACAVDCKQVAASLRAVDCTRSAFAVDCNWRPPRFRVRIANSLFLGRKKVIVLVRHLGTELVQPVLRLSCPHPWRRMPAYRGLYGRPFS